ncbi:MAG: AAA family ATPase [Thermoplasmatota archaeon]
MVPVLKKWQRTAVWMFLIALLSPAIMSMLPMGGSEWSTTVFEEAIRIERDPDHIGGRAPFHMEPVKLTISSRSAQTINAADVRFTWSYEGSTSSEGGYAFTRVNQTVMDVEIPGYPGGYTIQYRILAYDEKNHPLTSTIYSYTVLQNGSWKDTDFDSNIIIDWKPKEPKNGQEVVINITSRDQLVAIERADLLYTVNIPDQEPVDGVIFFERINSTAMTQSIVPYPQGSKIAFHIDAYDQYENKIVSPNYEYEYPEPHIVGPVYTGMLFVQLRDHSENGLPPKQATVTISNETYSYTMEAVNGIAFTNISVYEGDYLIEVSYEKAGKKITESFTVEAKGKDFTFQFEINKKTYKVSDEEEERPYIRELIGLVLVIVLCIGVFFGASRVKTIRETMNEKRKKARKKTEQEKDTAMENVIRDEELKEKIVRAGGILLLSLLGLFWAPFYPWWIALILAVFLTAVAWRFPYISLLLMAVLVTAAASYQSTEFGWVFLLFSLVVMIGGFFDWKYAYLSYLTIFAAGYGLGFTVPLIAAVAFSLFMGTVVLLTAGVFLLIIAPSGNFVLFSLLASPEHEKSFVQFQKGVDPNWSPVDVANVIWDIRYSDTDLLTTVLQDTMGSLIPLFGLLGWGLAMVAIYLVFTHIMAKNAQIKRDPKTIAYMAAPGFLLLIFGIISVLWAGVPFSFWVIIGLAAVIPASFIPFGLRAFGEEALPLEYGMEEMVSSDVGKKVSEMVGFRRANFKDIGGLEDVKREVRNALMVPLLEPEMATKYGVKPSKGVLLFGPPGCGKTLMLRAVASDLNVDMIGIKCSDVMSKWYGESENLVASLFEEARARSPCILFLDEIDAIAKRRDFYSTDDVTPRVLSIMLSEMDGMDEAEGIIIVATTNMPDLVDPALMRPGRFDKVIYVPPPDRVSREEIIRIHLKGKFASDDIDVVKLSERTKGFSGADLANLVREASSLGLERALETKKPQPITMEDMGAILDEIKPSVTPKMIEMYDKLRREYERKKRKTDKEEQAPSQPKEELSRQPSTKEPNFKIEDAPGKYRKKKEKVIDLEDIEHELDELTDWEEK